MPYVGYFALIKHTDHFILFDTPQYIRHGWVERNRILKPNDEPLYIKVPLKKHQRETKICDILIDNNQSWKEKIIAQLVSYKKKAPNYWKVISLVKELFEFETNSIVELNHFSLMQISNYLGLSPKISVWSKMDIDIDEVNTPDEWALNICRSLKADAYYNPIGGATFFDKSKYEEVNIDLRFMEMEPVKYAQFSTEFIPFLSILDVLMFCSVEKANQMIDNYKLLN